MSIQLRVLLFVVSLAVVLYAIRKIRKSQLSIDDSIYWIFFSVFLLILGIFPQLAIWASEMLGIDSPANFVFLVVIFLVLAKLFHLAIQFSVQKRRLNQLIQKLALLDNEHREMTSGKDKPEHSLDEDNK